MHRLRALRLEMAREFSEGAADAPGSATVMAASRVQRSVQTSNSKVNCPVLALHQLESACIARPRTDLSPQSACLRKNAGISISPMPLLVKASTLAAAARLRHLRHLVEDGQVVGAGAQRLLRRVLHGMVHGLLHHLHRRRDGGLAG